MKVHNATIVSKIIIAVGDFVEVDFRYNDADNVIKYLEKDGFMPVAKFGADDMIEIFQREKDRQPACHTELRFNNQGYYLESIHFNK